MSFTAFSVVGGHVSRSVFACILYIFLTPSSAFEAQLVGKSNALCVVHSEDDSDITTLAMATAVEIYLACDEVKNYF